MSLALPFTFFAQSKDTSSVALNEIVISGTRSEKFSAGKKLQKIDSLTKENFNLMNLSDLLSFNTPVFMKNYGPGNLSTSSFRGGNASQTAVLWNGFNIQNPMLGQNDFSQLPNFIFDDITVEYGGSASLWGSGAVGGTIQLGNKPKFNKGFSTLLNLGIGSYDARKLNSRIHYSNSWFSSTTKVYLNNSTNDFNYLDTTEKRQSHADYMIKGFLQELSAIFLKHHKLTGRFWYNNSFRNFAPTIGNSISKSSQSDENIKLNLDYVYEGRKFVPGIRLAYFDDVLNYVDSLAGIFSDNKTKTFISEADVFYKVNNTHKLYFGINYTKNTAITVNYILPETSLNKSAVMLGYNLNLLQQKLNLDVNLRQEFSSSYPIPFTGSSGITYQLLKAIKLKVNAAKVYRLPTLNDLYWKNGGNPDLKPEEGYTYEGTFDLNLPLKNFILQSELTYFNKQIQNWITWIPGPNSSPTPMNVLKVYSRGTETSSSISYLKKQLRLKLGFNSSYVLSTSMASSLPNDASVNKQLIYTPRYNYGANFTFCLYDLSLMYLHNYIGYRFTSSDNTSWLKPYHLGTFKLAYTFKMSKVSFAAGFQVNNAFNVSYKVIDQRPMPLRNYEVNISLTFNKLLKQRTNN
jgi:vitamin B12 transporter